MQFFANAAQLVNGYTVVTLSGSAPNNSVTIYSNGAFLNAWEITTANGEQLHVIDGYPTQELSIEPATQFFKSSKLAPFVCRTYNGTYQWQGRGYKFNKFYLNGSALHGLLYDAPFALVSYGAMQQKAWASFEYHYQGTDPGYPFAFSMHVTYQLLANQELRLITHITNNSEVDIPFADGWHPYFTLGGLVNDYTLQVQAVQQLVMNEAVIPTGSFTAPAFVSPTKLHHQHLDDCFEVTPDATIPVCIVQGGAATLRIITNDYKYLQVYTPDHRSSIAVENLSGAPDCFNNGIGLQQIAPGVGVSYTTTYQIT
ncbi:MAG: aldose 1-epimerase [Chitinophagaceae bacterium]